LFFEIHTVGVVAELSSLERLGQGPQPDFEGSLQDLKLNTLFRYVLCKSELIDSWHHCSGTNHCDASSAGASLSHLKTPQAVFNLLLAYMPPRLSAFVIPN
jgi:hypothetical protein